MKSLIVYDTKHGASAEVAERIAKAIQGKGGETELLDLREKGAAAAPLGAYDAVVLGGPYYMGTWSKRAKAFAARREADLSGKVLGLFSVGSNAELGDKAAIASLPASLRAAVTASAYVGGRLVFRELGSFERFIVKKVGGSEEDSSTLDLSKAEALGAELAAIAAAKKASK
jgi:menaquinone-dependent protoporphyrinogen IX oxidase